MEFTSLQCIASGKTDTTGNLAYHVQEPDPEEGMMNKLKKKRKKEKKERKGEIWWEKGRLKSWHSSGHSHETDKSEKAKGLPFSFPLSPPLRGR